MELIAENGRKLKPHDGLAEWSVCGKCGQTIEWLNLNVTGRERGDDKSCPHCGHPDTAYLDAD